MNFLEAFDELDRLQENGDGGQRTYKQFLIFLLKYLGGKDYHEYENWFLHHVNGDHERNDSFKNLVLMHPDSHYLLHGVVKYKDAYDYAERLAAELKEPMFTGGKTYEYIPIGKEIEDKLQELKNAALKIAC
jgi:hypothetical protein